MSEAGAWDFEQEELPYYAQLRATALRLTRNVENAEDLLQETYLKAFRHYGSFKPGTNLRAWLFKILKNTFINDYRRRKLVPPHVDFADIAEGADSNLAAGGPQWMPTPETALADQSLDRELKRALANLPHSYKVVVLLSDIGGYSYREVAGILSIPVGTVMSRLYRGRRLLERALLSFGVRYNYLHAKPRRLRSRDLELEGYFPDSPGSSDSSRAPN
jgi:RNA polymerase sigma-70 factor (ECF subfamily)